MVPQALSFKSYRVLTKERDDDDHGDDDDDDDGLIMFENLQYEYV